MIINDLQRLRWQILDEALRDPVMEYFMGERTKTNETGNTRSLIYYVNQRLKAVNREWSTSKRMLQNDVNYFQEKGARLEPRFRRGHKRILRYINLEWKNPLLRPAKGINPALAGEPYATETSLPIVNIEIEHDLVKDITLTLNTTPETITEAMRAEIKAAITNVLTKPETPSKPEPTVKPVTEPKPVNAAKSEPPRKKDTKKAPVQQDLFDGLF